MQKYYYQGYTDRVNDTHLSSDNLSRLTRVERESYLEGYWKADKDISSGIIDGLSIE